MISNILIKPASGLCNMKCKYCFYNDEMKNRDIPNYGMMSYETLETIVKVALENANKQITFAFQGGEPTLRGLDFFEKLIEFQKKYNNKNIIINNALQTNGYVIPDNPKWCEFFAKNNFLIGLSIDGTLNTHDKNRLDKQGNGTFLRCIETAELFKKNKVEFNILTVVNKNTAPRIKRIYQEFEKRGFNYQQYIACLEPLNELDKIDEYSLTPKMYGEFLVELFQYWYDDLKKGKQPYIRTFENYIALLIGYPPDSCEQNGICTEQFVIEADGSVFPCDFYMLDEYKIGNINTDSIEQIDENRKNIKFVENSKTHSLECRKCKYFNICRGGCNRNRIEGHSQFCESYKMLFDTHFDKMIEIAKEINKRR